MKMEIRRCDECGEFDQSCYQISITRKGYLLSLGNTKDQQTAAADLCPVCFGAINDIIVCKEDKE